MAKKYYWLKLKDTFFEDDTIAWIEEQENGVYYVNFYLKLCLKSLQNDGKLIRYVGDMLIPYDFKALATLTRTDVDTVMAAMTLFSKIGLVEKLDGGELYLTQINEMIGSETDKAQLMRKSRAKKTIGNNVTVPLPKCYTEIEIEKEIEIDKEIDISPSAPPKKREDDTPKKEKEQNFEEFWDCYPRKVGKAAAKKAYAKLGAATRKKLIPALEKQKRSKDWAEENGKFIPHPTTWLNQGRWDDELEEAKSTVDTASKTGTNKRKYIEQLEKENW